MYAIRSYYAPYGLQMVPVIKVGSNSKLSNRWFDLIDLDAGKVALGEKTIEEIVITSYSIHYTKLYEASMTVLPASPPRIAW